MKTLNQPEKESNQEIKNYLNRNYEHGFITDIATSSLAPGLDENVIRQISAKKNEPEFMLAWRLQAFTHWKTLAEPHWAHLRYPPIDYQTIVFCTCHLQLAQFSNYSQ